MGNHIGISHRIKIGLLVFVVALLLPILIKGIFVGTKPTDIILAVLVAPVAWFIRPKQKQEST